MPHLKVRVCGIDGSSSQWCGGIFILCYTYLKLALLLHKQGLVATGIATTVVPIKRQPKGKCKITKILFLLILSVFKEQNILYPGMYFSVGIKNDLAQGVSD